MILGLKRGAVELADHDPEWDQTARETIGRLWRVFGAAAKDIQHVGSTAIMGIKAKPVIDIAVAVFNFDDVPALSPVLEKQGFICVGWESDGKIQPMYQCGEFISGEKLPLILTHFIHIVMADSQQWHDYINHRDYMNTFPASAHEYESLKLRLAEENSNNYHDYFLGKQDYIHETVKIARLWNEFNRKFTQITPINKGWSEDKKYRGEDIESILPKLGETYHKDFHVQWTDGIPYKLKEPFDFSFLSKYGKVFKVFDDQDSGNICFGMADGENKCFVKFAGAPTAQANVSTEEAVERMKLTVPIYRDLAHPTLTRMINAEEIGGGFVMVFEWNNAECMGKQFPASRKKFMEMTNDARLRVFDEILDFHAHVAERGYVAIDFYDGSIMYDFNAGKTVLCDIEFYEKAPAKNNMGRMYGSSRFMSPEEFQFGAMIDEITNVYTMGAAAFAFFGNEGDRCFEQWVLSKELFDVAKKAVSGDRDQRQSSIKQFIVEWRTAK